MESIKAVYDYLCELAPPELQMDFDNSGFLLGRQGAEVKTVLLALDITDAVIDEAVGLGAELIVSHHPLIFEPLRSLTDFGAGAKALRLAEEGIAAICMHTNLDIAPGGVNDVLMALLGAKSEAPLDADGCGRVGELASPMPLSVFLAHCRKALNANGLRYYDAGRPVKRIAVMGGSGGSAIEDAIRAGCDTYLTSDIKYHQFLDAAEAGINLIDGDHFCTENPVIPVLADLLQKRFPQLRVRVSARHGQTVSFF